MVGDAGVDLLARPEGGIVPGGDVRAGARLACGGAGANTARTLRACGAEPTLVARIGADAGGRLVRAELAAAGVDCAFAVDPETATCCVVVLLDTEGQRSMLADRGAAARLRPEDVEAGLPGGAAHVHLSGYVLLEESSRPAGLAALAAARSAGMSTSVDPQAAALLTDAGAFLADIHGVDLLLPNAGELAALTGSPDPASAATLLGTVGAVAVTSGEHGAAWVDRGGMTTVAAEPVDCVDSTGAGDAFDAGVLTAWLRGHSPGGILRSGTRLAARTITHLGAQLVTY
ncbi:sugar kinase [Amycolatopsis cihanbeyliensis]